MTKPMTPVESLRAHLRMVDDELNSRFIDRADAIEALILGSITGNNLLMTGEPGTGKSDLADTFAQCINGRFFKQQFHQMTPEEAISGPLDLAGYKLTGAWQRLIDGYFPTADLCQWDEIDKTSAAVLGIMLTAWNEGTYLHGTTHIKLPALMHIGTSNANLDDPTGATYDRWLLRVIVERLDDADLMKLVKLPRPPAPPAYLSADDIRFVATLTPDVRIGQDVLDTWMEIQQALRVDGIVPSTRRAKKSLEAARAVAWMDGRDEATVADLAVMRHIMWLVPEQRNRVHDRVLEATNPHARELMEISGLIDDVTARLNTADAEGNRAERTRFGVTARNELNGAWERIQEISAVSSGRTRKDCDALATRLPELSARVMFMCGLIRNIEAARSAVSHEMRVSA